MNAGNLPRLSALALLLALPVSPAAAQTEVGAQLDLFSSYVWRGLTLTNKPVAQPDVWVSFPAGNATITLGHWANIDLGKYDDPENDISESGGLSAFNFAESNPYAEVGFSAGKASLTGGIVAYIYPNDEDTPNGGLNSDFNTWEAYGTVGFDVPLAPEFSLYYDFDKIKGAYFEGAVAHSVPLGPSHTLDLGGAIGFNVGQGPSEDDFSFNFADDGLTHVDFSAGVPLTAGVFSITPVVHLQISADDATKIRSPDSEGDFKVWGGVSIGWSNAVEEEEEAEAEVEAPAE